MNTTWQTVHVRVNDAATGQPTPVRLRVTDAEGNYFAPFGRLPEFATGRNQDVGGNLLLGMKPHAYINGSCEIRLPAGPVVVEANKGFEYLPLRQEVLLKPGQLSLRLDLQRWTNLRQERCFSGDCRAHFLTPHAGLLEAAAEDLAVVNLLASECQIPGPYSKNFAALPNLLAFSGQSPSLEMPGHMVVVNTHNTHTVLGSLGLLNCHRIVFPLSFGGPEGWDNWALADWCDQCQRKGGLVVWTKGWHESADFAYGEPLADLILGKVDAFEIDFFEDSPFDVLSDWYRLLNCGLRVPLVGSSGKDSNGIGLGSMRTYACLHKGEELTYRNWIEAIRAGRTFASNGPLLSFTLLDRKPGDIIQLKPDAKTVRVQAEARSAVPFECLEIVHNGSVVARTGGSGSPVSAVLEADVQVSGSGWLAARCRGQHQLFHRPANQRVFAHSSPAYVQVPNHPHRAQEDQLRPLLGHLDQMLEWVQTKARCENDQQRRHLADIFLSAREMLAKSGE